GFADEVITHPDRHAEIGDVADEPREVAALGEEEGDVEETEEPAPGHGPGARLRDELDERSARPEEGGVLRPVEHAESEDAFVEGDRAVEVGDLEANAAEPRLSGQPVARRREADG